MARLEKFYQDTLKKNLEKDFSYKNVMQIPKIEKIVLNMGVGEAISDSKKIDFAASTMELISGQKPIIIKAKKSVATFKLRQGVPIGVKVTLRKDRMYEFLDRLITIVLPRVRDFRGLNSRSFDGHGNFSMGLKEQIVFPEIDYDKASTVLGMDIIIVTTAKTNQEAKKLLSGFGMPFVE